MRKALVTLFSVGLLGALLVPSCVIKEDSGNNDNKGGASGETGGSGDVLIHTGGKTSTSTSGGAGGAGGETAASSVAACKGLKIISDDGKECGSTSMSATYNKIHMLIVLDKSGSMDQTPTGFGQSKWEATKSALDAALNASSEQVSYGLLMYPYVASGDAKSCELPTGKDAINVDVDEAKASVPLITQALKDTSPGGGTPTAAALAGAYEYYTNGLGASLPEGDKFVLLATDGGPNCNKDAICDGASCTMDMDKQNGCGTDIKNCCAADVFGPTACLDSDGVLKQIKALKDIGIKTFVVGIPGTENYESYLTQFAEAGGATNPKDDTLKYFAVTAADGVAGLTETFKTITESLVRSCKVKLEKVPVNAKKLNVAVECKVLLQGDAALPDAEKAWVYNNNADNPAITIQGEMCNTIEKQGVTRVDVIEGCTTMLIQ